MMKVKLIKLPGEEILIPQGASIHEAQKIVGRVVKERMRTITMDMLTEGYEWMQAERKKYKPFAKYLALV